MSDSKFEKSFFSLYFFNKDISFNIPYIVLKFEVHVNEGYMEGSVSQIFDLLLSFCFIKSRKLTFKK